MTITGNAMRAAEGFQADNLKKDSLLSNSLLASSRVVAPDQQRAPKHQSVIIFDWDDTLLCTTYLDKFCKDQPPSEAVEKYLREIALRAKSMLERAVISGHAYIITNATTGWVEYSAAKWAPELLPILRRVKIISARDRFEPLYPEDANKWKVEAFLEIPLEWSPITNIVALGDSDFEMMAAAALGEQFEDSFVKTVKFQACPNPAELLKQLEVVGEKFAKIVAAPRSIKMNLSRAKPQQPQQEEQSQQTQKEGVTAEEEQRQQQEAQCQQQ